jgi:hypothetical protein
MLAAVAVWETAVVGAMAVVKAVGRAGMDTMIEEDMAGIGTVAISVTTVGILDETAILIARIQHPRFQSRESLGENNNSQITFLLQIFSLVSATEAASRQLKTSATL